MKTGLTKKLTEASDITPTDLCETSSNKNYTYCKDPDKPVELMKEKLKLSKAKSENRKKVKR